MKALKVVAALVAAMALSAPVYAQQKAKALTAQDYAEIQQLYNRYAWAIDSHAENGMAWAKTFVPDGEFVNVNTNNAKTIGHEKLAEMMKGNGKPNPSPTHFTTNIVIEPAPEGARGSAYLSIVGGEKPAVTAIGTYQDVIVKTPEGWRFKQRKLYLNSMSSPSSN